jgi:ABC-type taurine transport system substrate-binding protein
LASEGVPTLEGFLPVRDFGRRNPEVLNLLSKHHRSNIEMTDRTAIKSNLDKMPKLNDFGSK